MFKIKFDAAQHREAAKKAKIDKEINRMTEEINQIFQAAGIHTHSKLVDTVRIAVRLGMYKLTEEL